jgi:hypothetical protein
VSAIAWIALTLVVLGWEAFTIFFRRDRWYPLTYHVRELMKRPLVWVAFFSFWLWLGYHFFVVG